MEKPIHVDPDSLKSSCEIQCVTVWGRCVAKVAQQDHCPPQKNWFFDDQCDRKVKALAAQAATALQADFLRVDILVENFCAQVYVSEAAYFPGSAMPPDKDDVIMHRFLWGYGERPNLKKGREWRHTCWGALDEEGLHLLGAPEVEELLNGVCSA